MCMRVPVVLGSGAQHKDTAHSRGKGAASACGRVLPWESPPEGGQQILRETVHGNPRPSWGVF